jgi:hypothetical protein
VRSFLLVVWLLIGVAGCASAPATEIRKPEIYPDRATPNSTWKTFLWAWRDGDVDALEKVTSLWFREDLEAQLKKNGRGQVSEWYRRGAEKLVVADARWAKQTDDLAYLDARLELPGESPVDVRFSFLRKDDGWTISGKKPLH